MTPRVAYIVDSWEERHEVDQRQHQKALARLYRNVRPDRSAAMTMVLSRTLPKSVRPNSPPDRIEEVFWIRI